MTCVRIEVDELRASRGRAASISSSSSVRVLAQRIGHVLEHGHRVEQRRALEHHAHVLPHLERLLEREVGDVLAVDQTLGRGRARAGAGCSLSIVYFPVPDSPTMTDRLARARGERHVLEDRAVEREIDVIELDDGAVAAVLRVFARGALVACRRRRARSRMARRTRSACSRRMTSSARRSRVSRSPHPAAVGGPALRRRMRIRRRVAVVVDHGATAPRAGSA